MADYEINFTGLPELKKSVEEAKNLTPIKALIRSNGAELMRLSQMRVPTDTYTLKRSAKLESIDNCLGIGVSYNTDYAAYQEYGTRFFFWKILFKTSIRSCFSSIYSRFRKVVQVMELLNPQAEITHALLDVLPRLEVATYFYLPQEEVSYPFFVVGDQSTNGLYTKERPIVTVQQVIHIFALADDLENVQQQAKRIEATVYNLQRTENFKWSNLLIESVLLMDDTTKDQLWHQVLTFTCQSN